MIYMIEEFQKDDAQISAQRHEIEKLRKSNENCKKCVEKLQKSNEKLQAEVSKLLDENLRLKIQNLKNLGIPDWN